MTTAKLRSIIRRRSARAARFVVAGLVLHDAVLSIQQLRMLIAPNDGLVADVDQIFNILSAEDHWHDANSFTGAEEAIAVLAQLRLIWVERKADSLQIRFPAGMTVAELVG